MNCTKCSAEIASEWLVCPFCGRAVNYTPNHKKRGNGQGSVYKTKNGKYMASVTLGYYVDDDAKMHRKTRTKVFEKKKDAIAALPDLKNRKKEKAVTFQQLYEAWLPTHRAGKDTMNCYKAAYKYFAPVQLLPLADIEIDDLQECMDDCPHGKRTKQNMKALAGLMYKYALPRDMAKLNLAEYLKVDGDAAAHRESFTDLQVAQIKKACGIVPHAELIYIMIYLGFRPSEFLSLKKSDIFVKNGTYYVVGGAKTDAGKDRTVPISSKILPYVNSIIQNGNCIIDGENDYLVPLNDKVDRLKYFTNDIFYPTLEAVGIDNPMVEISGGKTRHKYTPHSCRHTFATLMKRVPGADADKLALIGHTSTEQLRDYQDVPLEDLRKIIDAL